MLNAGNRIEDIKCSAAKEQRACTVGPNTCNVCRSAQQHTLPSCSLQGCSMPLPLLLTLLLLWWLPARSCPLQMNSCLQTAHLPPSSPSASASSRTCLAWCCSTKAWPCLQQVCMRDTTYAGRARTAKQAFKQAGSHVQYNISQERKECLALQVATKTAG